MQRHQPVQQAQRSDRAQQKASPVQRLALPVGLDPSGGGDRYKLVGQPE